MALKENKQIMKILDIPKGTRNTPTTDKVFEFIFGNSEKVPFDSNQYMDTQITLIEEILTNFCGFDVKKVEITSSGQGLSQILKLRFTEESLM